MKKKEKTPKEKFFFDLKLCLQRIHTVIKMLNINKVDRYVGTYADIAMYYIFVRDEFYDKIADNLSKIPFGSNEAIVAAKFVKTREWRDGDRPYYVVRESDVPNSTVWNTFTDVLAMVVNNINLHRATDDALYHVHPAAYGYASKGFDGGFRVEIFDLEDSIVRELSQAGDSWFALHDCYKEFVYLPPFNDPVRFMDYVGYAFEVEEDYNQKVIVRIGSTWECPSCGERIAFYDINAELLFRFWRRRFLHHGT